MGVDEEDEEKYRLFIGPPLKDSFRTMFTFNEEQVEEAIRLYREHHSVSGLYENKVFTGVREMLEALQAAGKKLYIATTKMTAFAEQILKHFELDKYFTLIIGGNPDGTRTAKKEIIAAILQTIPAEERRSAVMVGDRMFDLIGPKPMVSIPSPSPVTAQRMNWRENPTYIVHRCELAALLGDVS